MTASRKLAIVATATCLFVGCMKGSGPAAGGATPGLVTDATRTEAKELFATRCTPCHGPEGRGNGPAAAGLTPPPANFHDSAWQSKVTDEQIEKIIEHGGSAVGKSLAMPANPDIVGKPVVKALREQIRGFGKL